MAGNSPILAVPQVAADQNNKYITINDAIEALESVTQDYVAFAAVGGADVTLTDDESTRYAIYEVSGASANFDLIFTSENIDTSALRRLFVVNNKDTTYTCTVITDAPGASITIKPGNKALLQQRGDDIVLIGYFNDLLASPLPYDVGVFIPGTPTASQVCLRYTAVRGFRFADNFASSDANVVTNPTATTTFDIKKNGTTIGTVAFNTSGAPTFTTSGSGFETFAASDILEIVAPASPDATISDISITLLGERV